MSSQIFCKINLFQNKGYFKNHTHKKESVIYVETVDPVEIIYFVDFKKLIY
jgi:hypothetical protein